MLGISAKCTAEFSLPLQEVDILINNKTTEPSVLDQGSQIIVIRADLAHDIGATINTKWHLEMEGVNGSTSWTLGCTEHLPMRIGSVDFQVHAHIIETAPYCLLLG